jgi:hypothetical protein
MVYFASSGTSTIVYPFLLLREVWSIDEYVVKAQQAAGYTFQCGMNNTGN